VFEGDEEAAGEGVLSLEAGVLRGCGVGGEEVDGAGEGGVGEGADGAVEGGEVGAFVEVGDAEDGEFVVGGELEEGVEESADGGLGGAVFCAQECGEGIEDEEFEIGEVGEFFEEGLDEGAMLGRGAGESGRRKEVEVVGEREDVVVVGAGGLGAGDAGGERVFGGEDEGGGGSLVLSFKCRVSSFKLGVTRFKRGIGEGG